MIVSRKPNEYYSDYLGEVNYKNVEGTDFMETCSVFANTIHLTHGSCPDNSYGSIPILSSSIRGDQEKMKDVTQYIPLYLNLDPRDDIKSVEGEEVFDGNHRKMVNEIIRAIQELENTLIA